MVYQVADIVRDVRVAMDENMESEHLLDEEDVDTLSLNEIVDSKITEAARLVVAKAPVHLLDGGKWIGDAVFWNEGGAGWMFLPEDYLRLIIFKMSDWERPVHETMTVDDPRYMMQFSRYKGLRGNSQKPVVAVSNRAQGRVLEFYSCRDEDATIEQALYQPVPARDDHGGIEIPERCYRAVVYTAAGLALSTMGEREAAKIMIESGNELLL